MYDFGISRVGQDRYILVIEQPLIPFYEHKPRYYFTADGLSRLRSFLLESDSMQLEDVPDPHWEVQLDHFATESLAPEASMRIPQEIRDRLIRMIASFLLEPPDIAPDHFL